LKFFRNIMTVGFWTLMSRILGMAREVLLYALIGVGPVLDAFIVAFRLPNMFRRFFAEGAFNAAFVPMYSKRLENHEGAERFASDAFSGLAFVLMILTAMAMIFMPTLVWVTASGFGSDARFELAVDYGRVMFPYILLISLAALLSGALNARGRFAMASAAPVFLNILVIAALSFAWILDADRAFYLVWSIPLAGFVQLALLWWDSTKAGIHISIKRPNFGPDMRQLVKVAIPAALANGVVQINILVGTIVASFFPGAVSWLYGADRLYQLPLGVVGIAVGIVLLPELSKKVQSGDKDGARRAFTNASEISFALSFPAAVALFVIPLPLVSALFEHGATERSDAIAMAQACAIYAIGLPAFILQKVLQPLYFAQEDTKTPFRFALYAMVVNAVLALGLMEALGWIAPAIATTVSSWVMVGLLALGARRFGDMGRLSAQGRARMIRIGIAALAMGGALWLIDMQVALYIDTTLLRILYGPALVITGVIFYVIFARAIGALTLADIKRTMRRN
jgi:putative peptidoglycan lipid II flippase